ncbi:hypothetical protein AB685_00495 [Bacillus sp. LL01]|uniref:phosphotransferase n=1 Tax=Bacillus sp. LL01 TaxID=1665556 RepID=UPI00064D679C|nr:phosphotransferase [Bacillus sp. LL01]KMJ59404.1 hypothetical protein AB685_00495 [Bacillus sp. LL01]
MIKSQEAILEDILQSLSSRLPGEIKNISPITRGYLNLKWKVSTTAGTFLIKQFNKDRLRKYDRQDLLFALRQQKRLYKKGFPCPNIYLDKDNRLLESSNGEIFMVMEFCPGKIKLPGCLTRGEMNHLGKCTGRMHAILNDRIVGTKERAEFIPPPVKHRMSHWMRVKEETEAKGKMGHIPLIDKQLSLTERIDLDTLGMKDTGWAHRDLFLDNILFHKGGISAILDFDRLRYDYPKLDVARAVLSGSLYNNILDVELVSSFMEGYREHRICSDTVLIEGLRLLWYMESTWWIDADMDQHVGPPIRFLEEMKWLQEHYFDLEDILNG